ncbi:transmembrane protein, putative (macronuclear) [Tetrahymena thermophila SB210]|uniref:Transmembrane protein, putative n=1 Tax=Tetrahymena thermophila (strain SB210) TaxID=312017 RepID=Q22G07_TETTS|nr:transmembrane protein, putative [Tetrahymena thermophila SB210]EAR84219.2 transmembrane protein, putative [Tetrahymena thermophila SB210]|eukprot:XP_001031882.2 transmembrane protein, putative [Tetrahymena thermophila SB210]
MKLKFFKLLIVLLYLNLSSLGETVEQEKQNNIPTQQQYYSQNNFGSIEKNKLRLENKIVQKQNENKQDIQCLVEINQELTEEIKNNIANQLQESIKDDPNSKLTFFNNTFQVETVNQIIIKDLFIYDTIILNPITIQTVESVLIQNITIQAQGGSIYLPCINECYLGSFWIKVSNYKQIKIQDIKINVLSSGNIVPQMNLFNFQQGDILSIQNVEVLYYSQVFLSCLAANNIQISQFEIQDLDILGDYPFISIYYSNSVNLNNFRIIDNSLYKTSLFNIQNPKSLNMYDLTILQNIVYCISKLKCSLFNIDVVDNLQISSVNAQLNYAQQGYVLFQSTQSQQIILTSFYIRQNIFSDQYRGGIFKASSKDFRAQALFNNITLIESGSSDNQNILKINPKRISSYKAIQLDFPSVIILSSKFINNIGGALEVMNINSFRAEESTFSQNIAYYGAAITARTNTRESTFVIIKSNFTYNQGICVAQGNGGAINMDYLTSLKIQQSNFFNNTASINGGVVFFQEIQYIFIDSSNFISNQALQSGGVFSGKVISDQLVVIQSTMFMNKVLQNGGIFSIDQIQILSFMMSEFNENMALQSGGILASLKILQQLNFYLSKFKQNSAVFSTGGVIYTQQQIEEININGSQFVQNYAKVGGVFGFNIAYDVIIQGIIQSDPVTQITQNSAAFGGAFFCQMIMNLSIDDKKLQNIDQIITGNEASQSGNTIFQDIQDIKLVSATEIDQEFQNNNSQILQIEELQIYQENIFKTYKVKNVKSNSFVKLNLILSDDNKNQMIYQPKNIQIYPNLTEIQSTQYSQSYFAQLQINNQTNILPSEKIEDVTNQITSLEQTPDGSFELIYQINFRPNITLNTTLQIFPQIASVKNIQIIWEFRECVVGEVYISQGGLPLCFSCPNHTFSFQNPYSVKSCLPIPTKGVNESYRNVLILEQGFWRESETSSDILECSNSKMSCLGGQFYGNQICQKGHIGPLCEQCDLAGQYWNQSYTENHNYQCSLCSDISYNTVKLVLTFLAIMIFSAIVCRSAYKNTLNTILGNYMRKIGLGIFGNSIIKQNLFGIYAKLFLSFLQISQVIALFQVRPYGFFSIVMDTMSQPVNESLISFDCFLNQTSQSNILFQKLLIVALLPFCFILIIAVVFGILFIFGKISSLQRRYSLFTTIFYALISLLQFNIVLFLLEAQACRQIGSNSFAYLDLSMSCDNQTLVAYRYFLMYPLLVLWILVIPVGLVTFLWKRKSQLFVKIKMQFKFRFLYTEYKENFFYWEFIRLVVRILIAFLSTEFYEEKSISGLTCLFVLISYETILIKFQPFLSNQINYLESESIFIAMFTIFLSLIYDNLAQRQNDVNLQTYFWQQPSYLMGFIIFLIQIINFYFVFKYIYLSIYALIEHHRYVRKIEDSLRRTFPRFTFILKKRVNTIKVSMHWSLVKKLIVSGQVSMVMMKIKQHSDSESYSLKYEPVLFDPKENIISLRETSSDNWNKSTKNMGLSTDQESEFMQTKNGVKHDSDSIFDSDCKLKQIMLKVEKKE